MRPNSQAKQILEAETFQLPNMISALIWMLSGLSIKAGKIKLEKKRLNFYLMKVCLQWNVSPKFSVHSSAGL